MSRFLCHASNNHTPQHGFRAQRIFLVIDFCLSYFFPSHSAFCLGTRKTFGLVAQVFNYECIRCSSNNQVLVFQRLHPVLCILCSCFCKWLLQDNHGISLAGFWNINLVLDRQGDNISTSKTVYSEWRFEHFEHRLTI